MRQLPLRRISISIRSDFKVFLPMRKSFVLAGFAASALILLAVPAAADQTSVLNTSAAPTAPAAAPATASQDDGVTDADLDKIVCRRQPPPTGTRLGARNVCLTVRQWRIVEEDSQKALTNQQTVGSSSGKIVN